MDQSNVMLVRILNLAMQNGISDWNLSFKDFDLDDDYEKYFGPCVKWLEAEGLIRVGRQVGSVAIGKVVSAPFAVNIVLTAKGLAVLGQSVEINGKPETISSSVKKVSEGKIDYHRIAEAIGGLLGGIIKSTVSG